MTRLPFNHLRFPCIALLLLGFVTASVTTVQAAPDTDGQAHAAGAYDHADGPPERELIPDPASSAFWWEMLWSVVVFSVFFSVLAFLVWPKILAGLKSREDKIRSDLNSAEQASRDAQKTLETYQAQLAEAQAEARQTLEQARKDAEAHRAKLLAETEQDMAKQRERATQDIANAKQQALVELHAQAAELAVMVAGKVMARELTEEDRQRLIDQALGEINNSKLN